MGTEIKAGFACSVCGKHHEILPLSYSVKAPEAAALIPAAEWERRIIMTPDQCVIDGRKFYLRGRIVVPIQDYHEPFIWGVWAEISPKNFVRAIDSWNSPGRETEPPYPGWLDSRILIFGDTLNLELSVRTQKVGRRPHYTVTNPEHPLAMEQGNGISLLRVKRIAEQMLHR